MPENNKLLKRKYRVSEPKDPSKFFSKTKKSYEPPEQDLPEDWLKEKTDKERIEYLEKDVKQLIQRVNDLTSRIKTLENKNE